MIARRPQVRLATVADAPAIGALHVRAWRWAYAGLLPDALLSGLSSEKSAAGWRHATAAQRVWVAEADAALLGFCATGPARDAGAPEGTGEVTALYLEERAQGTGVGRALMRRALVDLDTRGFRRATLWVLESNARGRKFYEAGGWRADGTEKIESRDGVDLRELRYAITLVR